MALQEELEIQGNKLYQLYLQWLMPIILENSPIRRSRNWTILKVTSVLLLLQEFKLQSNINLDPKYWSPNDGSIKIISIRFISAHDGRRLSIVG